jgi:hypothetical protein
MADKKGEPFQLPADLSNLTVEQLDELQSRADAELDAILDAGQTKQDLPRAGQLGKALKQIRSRKEEIEAEDAKIRAEYEQLLSEVRPPKTAEPEPAEPATEPEPEKEPALVGEIVPPAPQLVTASTHVPRATTGPRELGGADGPQHRLNPSLSGARQFAPVQEPPRPELAITASVGLPGQFEAGAKLDDLAALGRVVEHRARQMGDAAGRRRGARLDPGPHVQFREAYGGVQVASIANLWDDKFDDTSSQEAVVAYMEKIQAKRPASMFEALVAGGGWCAPSQNRYDFFNIACEGGTIDLPTFGVERGGINFPVSPSLADTFDPALPWYSAFSNTTVPWLWTETDDILTVTGSTNKPCIRVPCSTMTDVRLECYGICLTAGNLADNAWPESTRNFLRLLMSAHYHAANGRYISQIVTLAGTVITGCSADGAGVAAPLLNTAELAAWDYRMRFGMCDTDVLEVILPSWAKGVVRADLAKRTGVSEFMAVTDAQIAAWFDTRNIRVQFVQDWQVRAAGQPGASTAITTYPSFVNFLIYAAGTVVRGNGMSLDLGVVRDSTLNAENDFTAAWMEECHLIAQFGHLVRNYRVNICADGTTGAADLTACC